MKWPLLLVFVLLIRLWADTQVAVDNFDRTNVNPILSPWITIPGFNAMRIYDNSARAGGYISDAGCYYSGASFTNNQYSQVLVVNLASAGPGGPAVRCLSTGGTQNAYVAYACPTSITLYKWVNGTRTALRTYTQTIANGATIKLSVATNTLVVSYNGTALSPSVNDNDLTSGYPGFAEYPYPDQASFDNWEGGTITQSCVKPTSFAYTTSPILGNINAAFNQSGPTFSGIVDSFKAKTTLPSGLSVSKNNGTISGTPTLLTTKAGYKIVAYGCGDSATTFDTITITSSKSHDAVIRIYPSASVQVGQEVLFDGEGSTNVVYPDQDTTLFEWDFGDGYYLKYDHPVNPGEEYSGVNTTHYYMRPGTFSVKLFLTKSTGNDTVSMNVTVTGTAPMTGFESWHAPFQSRTAQFLYVQIPPSIKANQQNALEVRLSNDKGMDSLLFSKSSLFSEDTILLKNSLLPAANYTITYTLTDGAGSTPAGGVLREFFTKTYNGSPRYGIDQYNNFIYNGNPYFPVTTWLTSISELSGFKSLSNQIKGEGYFETHDSCSWHQMVDSTQAHGMTSTGPFRPSETFFGASSKDLRNGYIHKSMLPLLQNPAVNDTGFYSWMWEDEPNLGGTNFRLPPSVFKAWTYYTHVNDNQRPVDANMYGYDYLSYSGPYGVDADFLNSAPYYGGKKDFWVDVSGMDIYPIDKAKWVGLTGKPVMREYLAAIDSMKSKNRDLIPFTSFIEVINVDDQTTPPPTLAQIRMEVWANIIHGVKGIDWFQYFGTLYDSVKTEMTYDYNLTQKYKNILATAPSKRTATDNSNVLANRVDMIVRDNPTKDTLYIFSVRVTEPDPSGAYGFGNYNEPTSITTTFTLDSSFSKTVIVDNESRNVSMTNGSLADTFSKNSLRIYKIPLDGSSGGTRYTLTVTQTTGGTITPATETVGSGTIVTITATPSTNYRFSGWTGSKTGGSYSDTILMVGNKTLSALWTRQYQLTVTPPVNGTINQVSGIVDSGTVVTFLATPNSGYGFGNWTGDTVPSANPFSWQLKAAHTIGAVFVQNNALKITSLYPASVTMNGTNFGSTKGSSTLTIRNSTNSYTPSISSWAGTAIKFTVPSALNGRYTIVLKTSSGMDSIGILLPIATN